MKKAWDYKSALKRALDAKRKAEADIWAIIGNDPDTESNPYQAEADLNQSNTVYARLYDGVEVIAVRYDPASDPRLRQWGSAVTLEYDGEYWISGPYKRRLTEQMDGLDLPTGALPLREHDHTSEDEGGTLGADTVDTTQLVDDSVTNAKISAGAVDTTELADGAVTEAKIDTGAVTNTKLGSDSVKVNNLNNLTSSIAAYVRQISNDTFYSEKVNFTNTAPTVTDDANSGYILASKWVDAINYAKYFLFSATPGAALWKRYLFSGDVVPSDTNTLDGASTAIVTQTASDTFSSIGYTLSANTRLYYDGTDIRSTYTYYENPTGALATSGTTELTIFTTPDLASVIDVTNSKIIFLAQMTLLEQSDATSRYLFYWKYNYDNGGAEAWEHVDPTNTPVGLARWSAWQVNRDTPLSFTVPFDSSLTGGVGYSAWGYSGTYKLRLSVARQTGTGTLGIFRPIDFTRSFAILEV